MMRGHWHKVIAVAVGGAIIVSLAINVSPWVLAAAALAIAAAQLRRYAPLSCLCARFVL
jgi:hypothetical protein